MPTVSVIIPTFNRSKLVLNALHSVLHQTYRDYEIIVVDDGSTDDTARALKPYMDRIQYVYQPNRGASGAQNTGVELATGKWVSILASDDVWLPTKLDTQLKAVTALGRDFGACFTNCDFVGNAHVIPSAFEQAGLREEVPFGPLHHPFKFILGRYPAIWVQSLLVLRSLVKQVNGFDEDVVVGEDTDLLFRLAFKTRFCFVNEPLVRIDFTPARGTGLMDLFSAADDRAFGSMDHVFRKWLYLRETVDATLRERIKERLRSLYYDWLVANLYRFRYVKVFDLARKIREMGDTKKVICRTLGYRAKRKAARLQILGMSPVAFYLRLNNRIWERIPSRLRSWRPVRSYGAWLHSLVCLRAKREMIYLGSHFLRNRPALELMRRVADQKPRGATLRIAVLGCSIGAEVYSILWTIRSARPDLKVFVDAADISKEILSFAEKGIYTPNTCQMVNASIFERLTEFERAEMFDWDGNEAKVKFWLREGITWHLCDPADPDLISTLGPQDMVIASNFLCHMAPRDAEKCLRNIVRLVSPGGYLFVSRVDPEVRKKVALDLGWEPVTELITEIHNGDPAVRAAWPWEWWGLEPLNRSKKDWQTRYATAFQIVSP
jgi:glycosyltransferase involved in cell wall biosynthesis